MGPVRSTGFVDPGWDHGSAQDEKKKKVKCNYCGKIVSGGIYRLKQHLARVSGEVTYCNKAPEEVYFRMKENLEGGGSSSHHHHHHHRSTKKPPPIPIPIPIPRQSMDYYSNFEEDEEEEEQEEEEEEEEENIGYRGKGKQVATTMEERRCLGYVDPGWEHCVAQDERKKKVKCNYCEKVVSGGINRFKQHLARIPGEVAPCKRAPEGVFLEMKENMKWHRTGRKQRRAPSEDENDDQEEDGFRDLRRPAPKRSRLDSVFAVAQTAKPTPPPKKPSRREVASAIWKFFYHAGVPLQAANSAYFHKMLELVGQSGLGLGGAIGLAPSQLMCSSDRSLEEEVSSLGDYLSELKAFWAFTGCSVLADSWRDARGRVLINFLASGPSGVYFVSSADATEAVDDAFSLFKLIDNVVEEIGEENVVQVVTRNTPSYKAAGKLLEEKRRNLLWTPCATDCINRMLEDFLKIRFVGECMEKAKKITKFIYNRVWLLNLAKSELTEGKEILRPALTRSASSFATLQSLLDHRTGLRRLFQSSKWVSSRCSKTFQGKEVEKIVMSSAFWKRANFVARSADPMVRVLEKLDGLSMPFVYREMCGAKIAMKSVHGREVGGPFLDAVESHWNSLFCHPIYMAAHFLNPSYRYQPDFAMHTEVVRGLNECIARLEPDTAKRISASMQLSDYNSAKADFGTELAIGTRTELDPAAWWQQHGISCLELQRIAVRVLSQTCSSIGCEHDWSAFDQMRARGQNRISRKRLDDLAYVHYNLRLRERQQFRKRFTGGSTPLDIVHAESLLHEWIVDEDPLKHEEMLCQEIEANAYEDETIDYEDVNAIVAPLNFTAVCSEEEDEEGGGGDGQVNYFDDDLTD